MTFVFLCRTSQTLQSMCDLAERMPSCMLDKAFSKSLDQLFSMERSPSQLLEAAASMERWGSSVRACWVQCFCLTNIMSLCVGLLCFLHDTVMIVGSLRQPLSGAFHASYQVLQMERTGTMPLGTL